ncbi:MULTISPECIES: PilN domain-containing protein [unclassified Modestobacter]|uniref:PilN domain-containing protein n=1 Tax=unclassified Modestobacter TaxID=2643866 RepID=UPI0022AA06DC|nr:MULTISPECIES: hypothetical protein [unclassified Modestobacter]MCZ2824687.1 hypothetical protein [Modestobacter sp. VKM Ac-2981]MCZ2854810.1 hypothetical protein [Modestobacter sp. VKM Ac-2982]
MSRGTDTLIRPEALPQVNLLPPEVLARRRFVKLRAWLALGLLVTISVCAAGWVLAEVQQDRATADLAVVEARAADLAAQQQRFAEVPEVLTQIRAIEAARLQVTETEVLWQPYLRAIAATAPDNVTIESLTAAVNSTVGSEAPSDPTVVSPTGTITFTARSASLPDSATWIEQLAAVPGLSSPWFGTASITESQGDVYYMVSAMVEFDSMALADRFTDDGEE